MFRVGGSSRFLMAKRTRGLESVPNRRVPSSARRRVSVGSVGGVSWGRCSKINTGITYASLIRNRDSRLVPRTDGLVEIRRRPEAKPGRSYWSLGFAACFGSESRLSCHGRIDSPDDRDGQMRLWTRFENELGRGGVRSLGSRPLQAVIAQRRLPESEESFGYEDVNC